MRRSISIIMPVHNVEDCLAERVRELLEAISEISPRVELLIVNNRSTDGTADIANDLARIYPQVRLIRNETSDSAAQAAMKQTYGDIVFIHANPRQPLSQTTLRQLWQMREQPEDSPASTQRRDGRRTHRHSAEKLAPAKAAGIPSLGTPGIGSPLLSDSFSHG